jgi:hypothetical protein
MEAALALSAPGDKAQSSCMDTQESAHTGAGQRLNQLSYSQTELLGEMGEGVNPQRFEYP